MLILMTYVSLKSFMIIHILCTTNEALLKTGALFTLPKWKGEKKNIFFKGRGWENELTSMVAKAV